MGLCVLHRSKCTAKVKHLLARTTEQKERGDDKSKHRTGMCRNGRIQYKNQNNYNNFVDENHHLDTVPISMGAKSMEALRKYFEYIGTFRYEQSHRRLGEIVTARRHGRGGASCPRHFNVLSFENKARDENDPTIRHKQWSLSRTVAWTATAISQ